MARAQDGGFGRGELDRASLPVERGRDINPQPYRVGFEQVMDSLGARYPLEDKLAESKASEGEYLFGEEETTVASIPARLHGVLLGPRAKAYVGREDGRNTSLDEDKSYLCADCGASMTITGSLANTTNVVEKSVVVDMAESGKDMRSTHSCMKTYFIKNRSGETTSITTPALYVKSVNQDLLSGKACNKIGIRIILDADPDIAGLYPLDKDNKPRLDDSIPFISEPTDLFSLKIEELDWRKFHEMNGFGLWH